jgi:hypothetical protein
MMVEGSSRDLQWNQFWKDKERMRAIDWERERQHKGTATNQENLLLEPLLED